MEALPVIGSIFSLVAKKEPKAQAPKVSQDEINKRKEAEKRAADAEAQLLSESTEETGRRRNTRLNRFSLFGTSPSGLSGVSDKLGPTGT